MLGATTVTSARFAGDRGQHHSGSCESEVMFRLIGDVADVKARLEEWVAGRAQISYGSPIPAMHFHTIEASEGPGGVYD